MKMSRLSYTLSPAEKRTFYGTAKLPDEFIEHLRTLFELLDGKNTGAINISDLEQYWGNEYHLDESLSNSVIIQRLHEYAINNNGTITFPRFCAGIKAALLDVKVRKKRPKSFITALDLSGLDINSTDDEIESFRYATIGSPTRKVQVRRSATVRERGRVERNERRRRQEFAHMEQRSLDPYYDSSFQCEEIQGLASQGIQMVDKIRNWYSRKHAQFDFSTKAPIEQSVIGLERRKVLQMNKELEKIINSQSQKNGIKKTWGSKNETEIIVEQQEKIAQLESEKSLLIRELFQLKAQLKSPVAQSGFTLFS